MPWPIVSRSVSSRCRCPPSGAGGCSTSSSAPAGRCRWPSRWYTATLFGNVLFAGSAPPAVVDLALHWRPAEWAAAVIVVDALAWGGADDGLADRWAHLPQWPQVLLRALLYRLAVNALHPQATEQSLAGLQRATAIVSAQLAQAA